MPWLDLAEEIGTLFENPAYDPWALAVHDSQYAKGERRENHRARNAARYVAHPRVKKEKKPRGKRQRPDQKAWVAANREKVNARAKERMRLKRASVAAVEPL